jgi:hypothetical protein
MQFAAHGWIVCVFSIWLKSHALEKNFKVVMFGIPHFQTNLDFHDMCGHFFEHGPW